MGGPVEPRPHGRRGHLLLRQRQLLRREDEGRSPEGEGALCDKKGNILLKGRWKEGRRDGEFLAFFPDGSYCSVTYEEDVKNGPCAFYDTQKSLVGTGNFEEGCVLGEGKVPVCGWFGV